MNITQDATQQLAAFYEYQLVSVDKIVIIL